MPPVTLVCCFSLLSRLHSHLGRNVQIIRASLLEFSRFLHDGAWEAQGASHAIAQYGTVDRIRVAQLLSPEDHDSWEYATEHEIETKCRIPVVTSAGAAHLDDESVPKAAGRRPVVQVKRVPRGDQRHKRAAQDSAVEHDFKIVPDTKQTRAP